LLEYAGALAWSVFIRFQEWLKCSGGIIDPRLTEVAQMRLLGYVDDSPQAASIFLRAKSGSVLRFESLSVKSEFGHETPTS